MPARSPYSELERIMLGRDEASLAPSEAAALRGQAPMPAAAPASNPLAGLRQALMGGGSAPAAAQAPAPAPSPPAASAAAPAARPAGNDPRAALLSVIMNPNASLRVQAAAQMVMQQMQPDTQVITTPDGAIIAVDKRTGQVRNLREAARPPVTVAEGARLVDPQTGRVIAEGGAQQTPDQRNYAVYVQQSRAANQNPDDFTTWLRKNRRESSGLDTPDEAFQKELGKTLGTQVGAIIEEGRQAEGDLRNLGELERLLGQIGTGAGAEAKRRLGELGIQFEGTDRVQAATAILNRITPQQRAPGSGATSDFDAKMFRDSLPRLINSPNGNRLIIDSLREVAENKAKRAEIAGQIATGELSRVDGFKRLNELAAQARAISSRVGEAARTAGEGGGQPNGLPRVNSPSDAARLPRGTRFIDPNGVERVVP